MAAHRRSSLRNLFDQSPTPHIAHPPRTHHRQFYVATDGSYRPGGGGLGAVIETRDGVRVARVSLPDAVPNNNVAEYRALHLGLDVLAARAPRTASVGVLVDHDDLAANVNAATLAAADPSWNPAGTPPVPDGSENHWRGILARISGFADLRAARIDSRENPAHVLANTPTEYAHVNREPDRCVLPEPPGASNGAGDGVLPPSRTERTAGD
ncbi:ribonuclease H [Haloprofundus halophilus]|uniref:ribonuclease H n=1 Tax=Haloprofundus halophilus TaxID=2283527 RepID=UPI000E43C21B|nr:ribonuclease H [Haloprofundus halophilus]